jgi:hypothetical protein
MGDGGKRSSSVLKQVRCDQRKVEGRPTRPWTCSGCISHAKEARVVNAVKNDAKKWVTEEDEKVVQLFSEK